MVREREKREGTRIEFGVKPNGEDMRHQRGEQKEEGEKRGGGREGKREEGRWQYLAGKHRTFRVGLGRRNVCREEAVKRQQGGCRVRAT